jgi:hypothetical protein
MQESIAASSDEFKYHKPTALIAAKDSETSLVEQDKHNENQLSILPI